MTCVCGKPAVITARGKNLCGACFSVSVSGTTDQRPNFPEPVTITEASICACRHAARDHDPKSDMKGIVRMSGPRVRYASCMYASCRCTEFKLPEEKAA